MSADPTSFADDVDCSSFFDQVEDLLDFPEDSKNSSNPLVGAFPGFVGMGSGCSPDLAAELSIPYEDIVQMEWLSTFMEDSFSAGSNMTLDRRQFPVANEVAAAAAATVAPIQFRSSSPISVLESSSSSSTSSSSEGAKILPISPDNGRVKGGCGRARSKRARPPAFNRGSAMQLISQGENFSNSSEQKKRRNTSKASCPPNPAAENVTSSDQSQAGVRKCLHCEITKTPQWRAGPLGPKTLCNACGVRYKSGRLFPEYRPAASPTFVPSLHSNSHKKVLEMRITTLDGPASDPHPDLIPNMDAMLGQD